MCYIEIAQCAQNQQTNAWMTHVIESKEKKKQNLLFDLI